MPPLRMKYGGWQCNFRELREQCRQDAGATKHLTHGQPRQKSATLFGRGGAGTSARRDRRQEPRERLRGHFPALGGRRWPAAAVAAEAARELHGRPSRFWEGTKAAAALASCWRP